MPKRKIDIFVKKIKEFIKERHVIYGAVLSVWGKFQILRARFIFKRIKKEALKSRNAKNGRKIVILTLRALPASSLAYFEAVFAYAFLKLGAEVKTLYCGGLLDSCDADTVFFNQKAQCRICKKIGEPFREALGLDAIFYKDYITPQEIKEIKEEVEALPVENLLAYKYKGVRVGEHAHASSVRYVLFGRLNLKNPKEVAVFRKKLVYAMIAVKVAEGVFLKEKPDLLFLLHGVYSTWGPFVDYFRNKGTDTIVYLNMAARFGHFIFRKNTKFNEVDSMDLWSSFKKNPLKEAEKKELDDYLSKRFSGKISDQKLYSNEFNPRSDKQAILNLIREKKYSRRYIMYPSLTWDCAMEGQISNIFSDIISWIDITVDFFKKHPEYQLIIKSHPAELVWEKTSKTVGQHIADRYSPLPGNITVLPPDAPVSAYELLVPGVVGIVYNGTLGLELAVEGIPVMVVADNVHYKQAGAVYDIKTLDEYLGLILNPEKIIFFAKERREMARRYAYFYLFKSTIRNPIFKKDLWSVIDWKFLSRPKKVFDENGLVMDITRKIINGEDIIA